MAAALASIFWENGDTWNGATTNTLRYTFDASSTLVPEAAKSETALEWLDRRVNEMRVVL